MSAWQPLPETQGSPRGLERRVGPAVGRSRRNPPLVVHVVFRLDIGGLENGLVNLINRLPPDEFAHAIVCLKGHSPTFRRRIRRAGVKLYSLQKRDGKDIGAYWRFWRLMRQLRPDIVHTRNLGTIDLLPIAALAGVPVRIHGEHGWDIHDIHGQRPRYRLLRRGVSPFVARFIALSDHLKDWLVGTVGLPTAKVVRICNGVDTARFCPSGRASPDRVPVVVGTVGRMEEVKDPLNLAEAFRQLLAWRPEFRGRLRLAMVGSGTLRDAVRSRLEAAGLADEVELPGEVADVRASLRRLDLFVLPSLNEGISNTILEAMACGLPVLATRVGGNPELVDEGKTGLLVPPSDPVAMAHAIAQYVDTPALRQEHGEAGRRRVERCFSLESMVNAYGDVYREALGTLELEGA